MGNLVKTKPVKALVNNGKKKNISLSNSNDKNLQESSPSEQKESLPKEIDLIEENINSGIAKKIKLLRVLNSMSQSKLAKELGVSFQQVQKYENGLSNLTVAKLCIIAKIFGTSVNFFFDENNAFLNNIPTQAKNISAVMEDIEMISGYFKKHN